MKGFPISRELSRKDNYPGTILYYFEISVFEPVFIPFGLSDKSVPNGLTIFSGQNYYTATGYSCFINGKEHGLPEPEGWEVNFNGPNVQGCGLVMDPNDKLTIFFTFNGKLLGEPIPISPSVHCLFPSVRLQNDIIEANFGDDPEEEPFEYDIENCPGMGLACI